jgi:signal transduction histidine kinase
LDQIKKVLLQYLPQSASLHIIDECLEHQQVTEKENISILELAQLFNDIEKNLAGSIGAASAHHAMKRAQLFSRQESQELSKVYAEILAELNITPEEMHQKINYYQERESMLINQAATLEELVKKRTEQLERAHKELLRGEKLATLGRLTATVSHELRNPLGTIRSSLYSIARRISPHNDVKINEIVQRAERNIERCDLIIDELLEYTRSKKLKLEETDLSRFFGDILADVPIPSFISITNECAEPIMIHVDRERIRRCIINLINNAIHSLQNKQATKDEYLSDTYSIAITTKKIADRVEVRITDTGTGIKKEQISNIFEPLFSTKNFGVGLGLSIVKQIVERHGGSITIESVEKDYTTAILWLPLKPQVT